VLLWEKKNVTGFKSEESRASTQYDGLVIFLERQHWTENLNVWTYVFYFEQRTSERDGEHRWLFHMGFPLSLLLVLFVLFQLLVSFPTASVVRCVLEPWLKHVGFCLIYGSLALKTWRWPFSFHTQGLEVACNHLTESYIVRSLVLECNHSRESYTWYCI